MKIKIPLFLNLLFFCKSLICQVGLYPEIEWQNAIGGTSNDWGHSCFEIDNGSFAVGGGAGSLNGDIFGNHGVNDMLFLKLDSTGAIVLQKCYGGDNTDASVSMEQTSDNGFILGGYSTSSDGDVTHHYGESYVGDFWVVKIDTAGIIEWENNLGGTGHDGVESISETTNGNFIVAGYSGSSDEDVTGHHGIDEAIDYWVIMLDSLGNLLWQHSLGGSESDNGLVVRETLDNGFIVGGYAGSADGDITGNHGGRDAWIVKLDQFGEMLWQKSYGGSEYDYTYSIVVEPDSTYLLLGFTNSTDGDVSENFGGDDCWLIKINNIGDIIWEKSYGGSMDDQGWSIYPTSDHGYIIGGRSESSDGDVSKNNGANDYWLLKVDSVGNKIWERSYGGTEGDYCFEIRETSDLGYIASGWAYSEDGDVMESNGNAERWVIKLSPECYHNLYFADIDNDGFGDILNDSISCNLPVGYVLDNTDCNDADNLINPAAEDICNTLDDNCNGEIDEDAIFLTWYFDNDGDDFGNILMDSISCYTIPGYVTDNSDCDDINALINPDAVELCNSLDDNCNGIIDEDLILYTLYVDADEDGFGDADIYIYSCLEIVVGYVSDSTDCDDSNNLIFPGAIEICDYVDNDCDGIIDDNLSYIHSYEDADADEFGNLNIDSLSCDLPDGFVEDNTDCDDTNPLIYPGAEEFLNGLDDNCNGSSDEGLHLNNILRSQINIYPNPASQILFIDYSGNENLFLEIINISGEIIFTDQLKQIINTIDISKFIAGVYVIKLTIENETTESVFVKE